MRLNELNREELSALYRSQMTRDFPPQELKPLKSMLELMEEGRYQALGLFDEDELLGYALVWREPGVSFALLDYLGTLPGVRNRGLGFYLRNGFRYGGYDCALFGVHYQTLIRGTADVSPEELLEVHRRFYQSRFPAHIYERFVQLPLAPGEQPNPPGNWMEE